MKKFLAFSERYFSSYLLFISLTLAASTIFGKGAPAIFFSDIWLFLFTVSTAYLIVFAISKFINKKYCEGFLSTLIVILVSFYFLNTFSIKYEYIPLKNFNESEKELLKKDEVILLEHGFGNTEKLKNYERAKFLFKGKVHVTELNSPLFIGDNRKVILTGDGTRILITRSKFLLEITMVSLAIIISLLLLAGKKWKQ